MKPDVFLLHAGKCCKPQGRDWEIYTTASIKIQKEWTSAVFSSFVDGSLGAEAGSQQLAELIVHIVEVSLQQKLHRVRTRQYLLSVFPGMVIFLKFHFLTSYDVMKLL